MSYEFFALHLDDDADVDFVRALLIEIAAVPGVTLVAFEANVVLAEGAELPAVPSMENGE